MHKQMPPPERNSDVAPEPKARGFLAASLLLSISRAWAQISNLVLLLLAARLLTIEEFGAFSLVSITVLILHQSAEAGWYEYATNVPRDEEVPGELLWCAIGAGLVAMTVALIAAYGIYAVFGSPLFGLVLAVMSPLPLMGAFISTQNGVHARNGNVIRIPIAAIPGELIGLAVGVWALLEGYGVLALAFHKVVMLAVTMVIVTLYGGWLAGFQARRDKTQTIVKFFWQMLLSRVVSFVQTYGADYLIAILLNLTSVGLYRAANRIAGAVAELVSETARIIGWAKMTEQATLTPNGRQAGPALSELFSLLMIFAVPAFVGMALVAEDLALVLLGGGWSAVGPLLIFISLSKIAFVFIPLLQPVMGLRGETRQLPRQMLIFALISLVCLAAIAHYGAIWAALSQLIAGLIAMPFLIWLLVRWGGLDLKIVGRDAAKVVLATLAMGGAIVAGQVLFAMDEWQHSLRLAVSVVFGGAVYGAILVVLGPHPLRSHVPQLYRSRSK